MFATGSTSVAAMVLVLMVTGGARAADHYVAPGGSDAGPGTKAKPFATIGRACDAVRAGGKAGKEPVTIFLRGGVHYLKETVVFTAADSGTKDAPVAYVAWEGETPVVSGGFTMDLAWEPHRDGILKARVPEGTTTDQLFVNGKRRHMARHPNFDANIRIFNGSAPGAFNKERAARWKDPTGGFIHAMHRNMWGDMHYVITGKNAAGEVTYEGGWQNNRQMGMNARHRMVENVFEELDAPDEWYLDAKAGVLYFHPPADLDMAKATVEGVRLRHLVEFRGSAKSPVRFVTLRGLTFRHAARTFMDNKEPLLRSDWTTYRGGAVFFNGAEDGALEDCHIDQVGGNAVFVNMYNRRLTVRGCHISDAGANAVAFVGDPKAVRSPLFEYKQRQSLGDIDTEPGPKTDNYPADCLVEECLIYRNGRVEKQTAGVQISMAQSITVRHCSIYDVPRAGINISEGTWGGHVIEFCDVFDTVTETGDHGSFNSWGRDRFWGLGGVDLNKVTLGEHKNLPLLDVVKPIILRNNRWRCDHGWDIDLDDGSSNYRVYNNLCLNGGIKFREGFYRVCENNIMVGNTFHPHVWYGNCHTAFARNLIWQDRYRPARMRKTDQGERMDYNLVHKPGGGDPRPAEGLRTFGGDAHSVVADAMFVDPAAGDNRVKEGSPALRLGFKNFAMDQFGVTKPGLKAIARTPALPGETTTVGAKPKRDKGARQWEGAQVRDVVGDGDRSAYGLPDATGVVVVDVKAGSAAASYGLRKDDVVREVNGKRIAGMGDLTSAFAQLAPGKEATLGIVRGQRKQTLTFAAPSRITVHAQDAKRLGNGGRTPSYSGECINSWKDAQATVEWRVRVPEAGTYAVRMAYGCQDGSAGSTFDVLFGEQKVSGKVEATGGWRRFVTKDLGQVTIPKAGEITVKVVPRAKPGEAVMDLRAIEMTKVK